MQHRNELKSRAKEISLGQDIGDVVVKANGASVHIRADGSVQKDLDGGQTPGLRPDRLATSHDCPLLEFDPSRESVIEPSRIIPSIDMPLHCVICFFQDVIAELRETSGAREISVRSSELGSHPIYEINFENNRLAVFHPGVGAALGVALLEEVIALGCRKFIACGGAGVLDRGLPVGHIMVPTSAIRDEGCSYHYLPPAREAHPSPLALAAIEQTLKAAGHHYTTGKTWTTDAYYRETRAKVEARKTEGCMTVDMEASAFFAAAEFRGVEFAQLLYSGDDLSGEWDPREWTRHSVRKQLFELAARACLSL
jgi:uridine phosphorylase